MGPLCWSNCDKMLTCGPICLTADTPCLPAMRAISSAMMNLGWDLINCMYDGVGNCDYDQLTLDLVQLADLMYLPMCNFKVNNATNAFKGTIPCT